MMRGGTIINWQPLQCPLLTTMLKKKQFLRHQKISRWFRRILPPVPLESSPTVHCEHSTHSNWFTIGLPSFPYWCKIHLILSVPTSHSTVNHLNASYLASLENSDIRNIKKFSCITVRPNEEAPPDFIVLAKHERGRRLSLCMIAITWKKCRSNIADKKLCKKL